MQHQRYKTHYSQNYQLRSFQQSPICAPSDADSDRSHEPFLYPTSLQPKVHNKMPKFINLKVEVTNLLTKLKEWLVELCLTENCTAEVNEQLEPIIDEIVEIGQQENESYWMETLNYRNREHSIKQSEHIFVGSGVSDNMRHCSVLVTESRAEVALLGQNEKNLVKLYFKRYYRMLENCLARINRCSGEKKLKFLVQTAIKNIFSETMRVSYDLKLVEHRIREQKEYRMSINRNGYVRTMANRIKMILHDNGNLRQAFRIIKQDYYEGLKRDGVFVSGMLKNMDKLSAVYQKNRRWALTRKFYSWRETSIQQKYNEELAIVDSIRTVLQNIIPHMIPQASREDFTLNWRNSIEININMMLEHVFSGQNCVFISLQEILKQPRIQKHLSIIQFLEQQQQQGGVTHRSGICRDHPFLGEFTCQELKNCVLSGEIYRSDRQDNSLLLIPIKPTPGIILVALATQPFSSLSFSKRPLSLHSFRLLLRIVEMLNPLLEQIAQKCKRIEEQWQQVDKQNHYQMFFRQFIKTQLSHGGNAQHHLQVNQRGHEQFQIDSHRLQYPNSVITSFMQKFQMTNLMVYHLTPNNTIKQMPCVILGDRELAKMQRHIINSIYLELISSGKQFLMITRNGRSFGVLPLKMEGKVIGFIHYMTKNQDRIEHVAIGECLVPLVLRYEGAIDCEMCSIKLALPAPQIAQKVQMIGSKYKLKYDDAAKLVISQNLIELEKNVGVILKSEEYLFQKMIYKMDLADPMLFYYMKQQDNHGTSLQFFNLAANEKITHNDIVIQQNTHIRDTGSIGKLVTQFPNFSNLQLHLYQYENTHVFRVIALPIKKENIIFGYLLVGHFVRQSKYGESMLEWLKNVVDCLSMNRMFKAVSLQDQGLSVELNTETEERSKLIENMEEKMGRWTGKGKLYEQMQGFKEYLAEQNDKLANFAILKLDTQNKTMSTATNHSDNQIGQNQISIQENTFQLLSSADIMQSHEKLMSQSCKLTKKNPNRTIRPMKIQKLYQTTVFVADLPQELRRMLIAKIKEVFQLQGWVSTQYHSAIKEITMGLNGGKSGGDTFRVLINLGEKKQGEIYYLLIEGSESQLNEWIFMSSSLLKSMKYKFGQIISECQSNHPTTQQKRYAITLLSKVIAQITSPRPVIRRWRQSSAQSKYKIQRMQSILQRILMPQRSRNRRYLSQLYDAMIKIKSQMYRVLQRYRIFAMRVFSVVDEADKRASLVEGFESIVESIEQPCRFNQYRACHKLQAKLYKLVRNSLRHPFNELCTYSEFIKSQTTTKRKLSVFKLSQIIRFIEYRQNKRHFMRQIHSMQKSFEQNLSLISLQYKNMRFYSREAFMQSINVRFNTIIKQISYSHIARIDVYCAQKQQNLTTVYKIDEEDGITERNEVITASSLSESGIVEVNVPCLFGNYHSILYKVVTKTQKRPQKELFVVRKVIEEGIVPCYSRYLNAVVEKAEQMCKILLKLYCREMFNGSSSDAQKLYIFGRGLCPEQQCHKLRVMCRLRSLKKVQKIHQTKQLTNAINEQSKNLYSLQYEHNALSGLLSGNIKELNEQQSKMLDKYGSVVTRNSLKEMRQSLQLLQMEQQKKLLRYQIKSKTFATSKIITFLEKRENAEVEKVSYEYLIKDKENDGLGGNQKNIEKVYVEKKLELNRVKEMIREEVKKEKKTAARAIWLLCNQLMRGQRKKNVESSFQTMFLPKRTHLRKLM